MMKEDVKGLQVVEVVSDGVWQTQLGHVTPRHPLPTHGAPKKMFVLRIKFEAGHLIVLLQQAERLGGSPVVLPRCLIVT